MIAGQLLVSTGGSWSISLYVLAMAAVSFVCIWMLSEAHLTDLKEIRSEERRLIAEARESAAGQEDLPERRTSGLTRRGSPPPV